ncbi:MAG: Wzz/FepE/Etk N-terminal domain-containing protein [Ignavibacteriaceae bacterium]
MESSQAKPKFSDYLSILYKWKKLLIINLLIIIVLATVYSYLIPEQFKATSIVMVSTTNQQGIGGLGSILTGDLFSMGSQLLGGTNPSFDMVLGILNSRTSLSAVINKYNLMEYYGIDDKIMDKALKAFVGDVIFQPTENGLIEVSVINEDPNLSAEMANYFIGLADSIYTELNIEQARSSRIFVEKRYKKNIADLKAAEDSFYVFQKKYGIVAVPEQLEVSIKAAAELEALYAQNEITEEMYKQQYGENSPLYRSAKAQVEIIKKRIQELKDNSKLSYPSNVLYPFSKLPDVAINYYRVFRDVEIQTKILEFVLPMYEQALVEEQKSIPNLLVIDEAVPPQLKHSPKKAFIVLLFFFLALFIHLPLILWLNRMYHSDKLTNTMEEKAKKVSNQLINFYKMKL